MKFENKFTVKAPAQSVWAALMDFERVVPCMPGAEVLERRGEDAYQVQVRVKVGPMSMMYRGQAEITDRDDEARTAAMRVQARETRGQGSANATVQIKLGEEGAGTRATMSTELKLSGRAAAMGRGVVTDVSQALVSEFAEHLAKMLSKGSGDGAGEPVAAPQEGPVGAAPAAVSSEPAPGDVPPPSPEATPSGPPPPSRDALNAAQLARTVVTSRLREPKALLSAGGVLAVVCLAVGFGLGRRAGRR
jgi:carbon monoxide dehydrogenase subunit G